MDKRGFLDSVAVVRQSEVNGASTRYDITFTSQSINILSGDIFSISFPSEIALGSFTCSSGQNVGAVVCNPGTSNSVLA